MDKPVDCRIKMSDDFYGEERWPMQWKRVGVMFAIQPLSWHVGIDHERRDFLALDLGPFRITVNLP